MLDCIRIQFFVDMMVRQHPCTSDEAGSVFIFSKDLAESSLGIIKHCDITYLQEPRRETCPVNVGGGGQCMSLLIGCGFKTE